MKFVAAFSGFFGVSMGAFGAHALKPILSSTALGWWQTATLYLLVHSVLFVIVTLNPSQIQSVKYKWICRFLISGNILFAGSLYIMALTQIKILGAITPLGGLSYLMAWGFLAFNKGK